VFGRLEYQFLSVQHEPEPASLWNQPLGQHRRILNLNILLGIQHAGRKIWCQLLGFGHSLPSDSNSLVVVISFTTATSEGCAEVVPVVAVLPWWTFFTILMGNGQPAALVNPGLVLDDARLIFTHRRG